MNSEDYFAKLDNIISCEKFIEINFDEAMQDHPTIKSERSIQYYLNRYIKPFISHDVYASIYTTGSNPGALYGLAKVHKEGTPLCPVISMIGTPQYGLAKYLDNVIKPCIPNDYMLSSTQDFMNRLYSVNIPSSYSLVSLDIVSLLTNVPLKEVIDLATECVYKEPAHMPRFDKKHFR